MSERLVEQTPIYRQSAFPVDDRVDDLLRRMTLPEKVGQLNQRMLGWDAWAKAPEGIATTEELDAEIGRWGSIGAVYGLSRSDPWTGRDWSTGADPQMSREVADAVQSRIVSRSRLGIPALFVEEVVHGHQALAGQVFPTNVALASTWRPDFAEEIAAHAAREVRFRGAHLALVSGLDMLREPRWGRAEECFGEDPVLAAEFVRATVRGMKSQPGLGVVLKAFAAHGAPIGGRNASGAPLGPRELREIHLPAARAGIEEGAVGVMAAYNEIDGIPCTANRYLLTEILRDSWGFRGIVMSDAYAVDRLMRGTGTAELAGATALRAGVDLSMFDQAYTVIEDAVALGVLDESVIDRACSRILRLKVELGLLDEPLVPHERDSITVMPEPIDAARVATSAVVLLEDDGTALPVQPHSRIAVIGPNADNLQSLLGDYVAPLAPGVGSSVFEAIRARRADAKLAKGCELLEALPGGVPGAVRLAEESDVAIVVLGSSSQRSYGDEFHDNGAAAIAAHAARATSGEGFDVAEVALPEAQLELVRALAATNTPLAAVIVSGRPLGIEELASHCAAVLWCGFPGPDGGEAIAGILLGESKPTGRLPVTLPSKSGVLPVAYNERIESTERYVDAVAIPKYRFGFGRTASAWELGVPRIVQIRPDLLSGARAEVCLRYLGVTTESQVLQLYGRVHSPGILPRRAMLLGFTYVGDLGPGEERVVSIAVSRDAQVARESVAGRAELWVALDGAHDPEDSVQIMLDGHGIGTAPGEPIGD